MSKIIRKCLSICIQNVKISQNVCISIKNVKIFKMRKIFQRSQKNPKCQKYYKVEKNYPSYSRNCQKCPKLSKIIRKIRKKIFSIFHHHSVRYFNSNYVTGVSCSFLFNFEKLVGSFSNPKRRHFYLGFWAQFKTIFCQNVTGNLSHFTTSQNNELVKNLPNRMESHVVMANLRHST